MGCWWTFTLGIGFLSIKILTNIMGATLYEQLVLGISIAALASHFLFAAEFYNPSAG
jgi:hypothetical protein